MNLCHSSNTCSIRNHAGIVTLAVSIVLAVPPLQAQPATSATPRLLRSIPPESKPNPTLEAALREALFPVQINDDQGHGPDPGSAEANSARRWKIKVECERMPAHRYTWSRVDLNGDGRSELLAQVVGPMFCGTGGCPLLIFREPSPGKLQLVTQMSLYDGRTYPANPSLAPAIPLRRPESGTAYLQWNSKDPRAHTLACDATY
ncbi:MAG: hypothetical protein LW834_15280 [Cyanobium sp. 49614_E6]|nr:hypothetical protein [Cyanobium sp. 49614_E6]